uniref:SFRICE_038588 n=1 Tax=Spodoptera frugiperda TaxID=7108 RepID=A0A2H1WJ49_SPOFR
MSVGLSRLNLSYLSTAIPDPSAKCGDYRYGFKKPSDHHRTSRADARPGAADYLTGLLRNGMMVAKKNVVYFMLLILED